VASDEAILGRFASRPVGTTGHEILADGEVVAWTADGHWALLILALLTKADEDGLTQ
jgi:hypothetical protein